MNDIQRNQPLQISNAIFLLILWSLSLLVSASPGVASEAVRRHLWCVYMLQITLKLVAIKKIVTTSNPGGQWLLFRGLYKMMTLPSLPIPPPPPVLLTEKSRVQFQQLPRFCLIFFSHRSQVEKKYKMKTLATWCIKGLKISTAQGNWNTS